MSVNSDTGGAESPMKDDADGARAKKPQRHRVSFADDITGDKSALSHEARGPTV